MFVRSVWRRLSLVAIATVLLVLSGCAGAHGPERWNSLPEDQRAVIFGTVTAEETGILLSRSVLYFRNLDTQEVGSIETHPFYDTTGNPDLYERHKKIGWVFELTLPPGRYEFFRYFSVRNLGQFGSTQYRSKQEFSVPFAVEAGKIHYLGEYRAHAFMGRNIFGIGLPFGGYFVVLDQQARDTALLAKQRKAPVEDEIVNIVPKPDPSVPLVRQAPYRSDDKIPENTLGSS